MILWFLALITTSIFAASPIYTIFGFIILSHIPYYSKSTKASSDAQQTDNNNQTNQTNVDDNQYPEESKEEINQFNIDINQLSLDNYQSIINELEELDGGFFEVSEGVLMIDNHNVILVGSTTATLDGLYAIRDVTFNMSASVIQTVDMFSSMIS